VLARLLTDQATILTRTTGSDDPYGQRTTSWVEQPPVAARFQQQTSVETVDGRDTVVTGWMVVLAAGTPLGPGDRVRDQHGTVLAVDGTPARPTTPRGEHHVEARLREVTDL
jgi:hypothetical protein